MLFSICFVLVQFIHMMTVVTKEHDEPKLPNYKIAVSTQWTEKPQPLGYLQANSAGGRPQITTTADSASVFQMGDEMTVGIGHSHRFKRHKIIFSRTEDSNHNWCHSFGLESWCLVR
jgi:hypothetical protein